MFIIKKRVPMPYREVEWLKDRIYEKEIQEDGMQQVIKQFKKIKDMEVEKLYE